MMAAVASVGEIQQLLQLQFLLGPLLFRRFVVAVVIGRFLVDRRPEVGSDVINGGIDSIAIQSADRFRSGDRETSLPQITPNLGRWKVRELGLRPPCVSQYVSMSNSKQSIIHLHHK